MDPFSLAVIFGATGAAAGAVSTIFGSSNEQQALRKQKQAAWKAYELGKDYSDRQYGINRSEAQSQAAIQQGRLDQSVGASVDQFNLGLLSQAYGIQNAQIGTASSVGSSLAAEGMSGTRGNEANSLMRAYEETNLNRNIALQLQSNDLSLQGMITQGNNAMADITRERNSWDAGGYRYSQKQAQDEYNLAMAQLGQQNFDWQIDQADWAPDLLTGSLNLLTGGLSGASSGLGLWNSWNEAAQSMNSGGADGAPDVSVNNWASFGYTGGLGDRGSLIQDQGGSLLSWQLPSALNNPWGGSLYGYPYYDPGWSRFGTEAVQPYDGKFELE
jgi:hypothetical protein